METEEKAKDWLKSLAYQLNKDYEHAQGKALNDPSYCEVVERDFDRLILIAMGLAILSVAEHLRSISSALQEYRREKFG